VTFLFTDIEGSTQRWDADEAATDALMAAHDKLVRTVVEGQDGYVFATGGDGFAVAFERASEAVAAAVELQESFTSEEWASRGLRVRLGLHTGEAVERDGDYFGPTVNRAARIMALAHGGQILLSTATAVLAPGFETVDLGEYQLRGMARPERLHQVVKLGLARDFPPLRAERAAVHNLPVALTSFVGRQAEIEALAVRVSEARLVTLVGPGGAGKTRLAVEVVTDVEVDFGDGVFFIDLSAVSDPNLVGPTVAGALRLQLLDPTPAALADYFASRQTLLLLDNCEHLLDACADVADALLGERCPRLRILATSREPLGVEGERVFRVPSLDIEAEAVALFLDRARAVRPDLPVDIRSEATIAEICRRLDGIPLAIELAATRAAHLSLAEILERLNDRFRLLVGGRRRIQRQQTLTAALDWSYDLLGPDEQLLLCRLAVFRGSFSLRAAEAVCHPKAMELLGSLVAKSLVLVSDDGENVRYRLLESVRMYAEQKLVETGESEQLWSAHRDWYLEWIESLPPERVRCNFPILGMSPLAPLGTEADNLTGALEWCRQQGRYELCARLAIRMSSYWVAFVRLSEMMAWWRELDAGLPSEDRDHRAMALLLRSRAAWLAGEWDEANLCSAQASALADDDSWVGSGAQYVQAICWAMIDPARSDPLFRRAFQIDASLGLSGDPVGYAHFYLSRLQRARGRGEARALLDDWLADLHESIPTLLMAAVFALYGDAQRSLQLKSQAEPAGAPVGQLTDELSEAVLASASGRFDEAERHLVILSTVVRDFAIPNGEAACLIGFAKLALDRGDLARALRLLDAVKTSAGPEDHPFRSTFDALVYAHCAGVLQKVTDPERAGTSPAGERALSLKEALEAELSRSRTSDLRNPAD
jgi:predicted ATPase/class 3 adenylate cyclase